MTGERMTGYPSNTTEQPLVYYGENENQVCLIVTKKEGFERFGFRRFNRSSLVVFQRANGSQVLDFRYIERGQMFKIVVTFDPAVMTDVLTQFHHEDTLDNGTQVFVPKLTTDVLFIPVDKHRSQFVRG
jgi:hypothetical protein